ncbi:MULTISPECIES: DUF1858 domain-containing protein [Archaeoglobus]|jgi:hypothetical protein|uniref:DUF1858 domain-containing protein n=2 Tax=Archaeoglobus fulgidus TaxID=2234 RepID=O30068_ARCFU|nr:MULTISPECIES: DUF1858 domain-containing protein [Archaeoglobus]AAB91066.1 predicted coding region AF_0169 [Archaeoglobus fulgidus DSM 4304]KUJ93411.1 MAG: hypothetical protein XD40_1391 [Archaeoglobus fulgidus]KUK06477.1 MAG: hypothetical protein XD48_1296 [Archaeoglobus fulgidus]MDI3497697.1 hypothetical protein [Archaeoglobus sp.]
MVAISDLRGLSLPEALGGIVEAIENVEVGEQVQFVLDSDADVEAITTHLSEYAECSAEKGDRFILLKVTKRAEFKADEEEEFRIDENTNVGRLIERYPEATEILASYGFTPLRNPVLRKTLAKTITLGRAKMLKKLSDEEFEEMLRKLRELRG